jgi:hypothetical protein
MKYSIKLLPLLPHCTQSLLPCSLPSRGLISIVQILWLERYPGGFYVPAYYPAINDSELWPTKSFLRSTTGSIPFHLWNELHVCTSLIKILMAEEFILCNAQNPAVMDCWSSTVQETPSPHRYSPWAWLLWVPTLINWLAVHISIMKWWISICDWNELVETVWSYVTVARSLRLL